MAEVEYDAKTDFYKVTKPGETFNVQSRDIKLIKSEGEVSNTRFQRLPFGSIMMRNITMGPEYNRAMEDLFLKQLELQRQPIKLVGFRSEAAVLQWFLSLLQQTY